MKTESCHPQPSPCAALLERLENEYGPDTEVARFIENWQLAPGKLLVATSEGDRFWVVEHNPRQGPALGYGCQVKTGRELGQLEKVYVG